jgi:Ca-activated chloride channel family protein
MTLRSDRHEAATMQLIPDSFVAASRLWLLGGVLLLAVGYIAMQLRRQKYAVRFTNLELLDKVAPARPGWRRHLPAAGFIFALAALVVAFARPAQDTQVPKEQATIVMAIDTSLSMQADDVRPTRLDGAKEAAIGFIGDLPDNLNLGLISFNGVATIRVQPSTNHEAAVAAVESLELGPATAIGEAIFASLAAIDSVVSEDGVTPPARIVLMSDGETTVGRADQDAIEAAQQAGIAVSTIAFGTEDGIIVIPEEDFPIGVPVNREKLETIADSTGGQFFAASSTAELSAVYEDIGSQVSFETIKDEISTSFIAITLIALTLSSLMSLLWFARLP